MGDTNTDVTARDDAARIPPPPPLKGLVLTLVLVGATSLATLAIRAWLPVHLLPSEILPLVFLTDVLLAAVAFGFWCGLFAAVAAFAALNFLFTQPLYTFQVAHLTDLVALIEFLLVAALSGFLAGRLYDRAEAAKSRAEALAVLGDHSSVLASAQTRQDALTATLDPLRRLGHGMAVVVTPKGLLPPDAVLDPATQAAAERAMRSGHAQPASAPGWDGTRLTFLPLTEGTLLGHAPLEGPDARQRAHAIAALVRQTRLALQRLDFEAHARAEGLRAETEAARAAVLSSFGHDLRTPLATILGAASSLKDLHLPPEARADLLTAIEEEASRLNAHVSNLMQLSRLELIPPPRRSWVDVNDRITAAAARLRRADNSTTLQLALTELPMIQSDGALIEQAVFNIIDNARVHGQVPLEVSSHEFGDHLCIAFRDHGPGLPREIADWLAGPELRPAPGQSGLGLAVAKGIARHLGGSLIWADGGFTLNLPKST